MAFTKPVPILTEFLYSNHPLKMRVNEKEQGKKTEMNKTNNNHIIIWSIHEKRNKHRNAALWNINSFQSSTHKLTQNNKSDFEHISTELMEINATQ